MGNKELSLKDIINEGKISDLIHYYDNNKTIPDKNQWFEEACTKGGHLEIIKWFVDTYPEIKNDDTLLNKINHILRLSARYERELIPESLEYFLNLKPELFNTSENLIDVCRFGNFDYLKVYIKLFGFKFINNTDNDESESDDSNDDNNDNKYNKNNEKYNEYKPDSMIYNECFYRACVDGSLEMAKYILELKPEIDISCYNEKIFRDVCEYNQIEVAKWLLEIKPDINIRVFDDCIFKNKCENIYLNLKYKERTFKEIEIAKLLIEMNSDYFFEIKENKVYYKINKRQ